MILDRFSLKGKTALVTGSSRGLGAAIAIALAEAGANVAVHGSGAPAEATRSKIGGNALALAGDVADAEVCAQLVDRTIRHFGALDILVNNAGIIAVGAVADFSEAQWDRVMAVNAKGPFLCAKACIPHLTKNREGAIVNIASIAGKKGYGGLSAYCASKFAVVAFTQALAEELGPANIRVNAVCPGFLRTAMWTEVLNKLSNLLGASGDEDNLSRIARTNTALQREQTPADIGEAVVYLARADNVTGIALNVAGGAEVH